MFKLRVNSIVVICFVAIAFLGVSLAVAQNQQSPVNEISQAAPPPCGTWDTVLLYDFEAADGGFVPNTPPGEWAWGDLVVTADSPPAAFSGSKLWATNLAGNITSEPSHHYLTTTLDVPVFEAGVLQWWDWWHTDGIDEGRVTINGELVHFIQDNQLEWVQHTLDLAPWQGETIEIEFHYMAQFSGEGGAGWYVDDLSMSACDPVAAPSLMYSRKMAPETAVSNQPFLYTLQILNNGGTDAPSTALVDPLPPGTSYVAGSATNGASYNQADNQIEWTGDVAAGERVEIMFEVTAVTNLGTITNTATLDQAGLADPAIITANTQIVDPLAYGNCVDFEGGVLPPSMFSEVTTNGLASGQVTVTGEFPQEGGYALNLDTDCGGAFCGNGTYTRQAAVLAADLAGQSQVEAAFWIRSHGDNPDPEDGLFISDDGGQNYTQAFSFNDITDSYQYIAVDIGYAAAQAGLQLNDGFLIKFQSYDNYDLNPDGFSIDHICVQRLNQPEVDVSPGTLLSNQDADVVVMQDLTIANNGAAALTWQVAEAGMVQFASVAALEGVAGQTAVSLDTPEAQERLALFADESTHEQAEITLPAPQDEILYDQFNGLPIFIKAISSQKYEESLADRNSQAADDFIIPAEDGAWTIRRVEALGIYFNGQGPTPLVNVYFYKDELSLPGDAVYTAEGLVPTWAADGNLVVDLPMPAVLGAGHYWFSVQADMDLVVGGQWQWQERQTQSHNEFSWRNPGNGSGRNCIDWTSSTGCSFSLPDLAYRLSGSVADCIPQDVSWLSLASSSGQVAADSAHALSVTFDSTGLENGDYVSDVCFISNDPHQSLFKIPVNLVVGGSWQIYLPIVNKE